MATPLKVGQGCQDLKVDLLRPNLAKEPFVCFDLAVPELIEVLVVCVSPRSAAILFNLGDGCCEY
jgi:hypothetical protein